VVFVMDLLYCHERLIGFASQGLVEELRMVHFLDPN